MNLIIEVGTGESRGPRGARQEGEGRGLGSRGFQAKGPRQGRVSGGDGEVERAREERREEWAEGEEGKIKEKGRR